MPHDDPSGPPPYNPGGPGSDDADFLPETGDFHEAVEKVKAAVEAQKNAVSIGKTDDAKQHAAASMHYATDMLRHLRQQMAQSGSDGEAGKTF